MPKCCKSFCTTIYLVGGGRRADCGRGICDSVVKPGGSNRSMSKINTAPVGGTRDFLPLEVLRRNFVIGIIERVYQAYGFEPLQTPALERLETLLGKYGEEGDQLIFRVLKRGAELQRALADTPDQNSLADGGLRYDLTVPLA